MSAQPETKELVEVLPLYTSAQSFLDALAPNCSLWEPPINGACSWIFRGQPDATQPLIPRAWRADDSALNSLIEMGRDRFANESQNFYGSIWQLGTPELRRELFYRCCAEHMAVKEFVELADELGLVIPDYKEVEDYSKITEAIDLTGGIQVNDAFGLAQHHGVPTRLLDWTRSGRIAAFFATNIVPQSKSVEAIAVWAMRRCVFDYQSGGNCLDKINIPRHLCAFLHAQHGIQSYFAAELGERYFLSNGCWPTYEEIFQTELFENLLKDSPRPMLRKLTLCVEEVQHLRELLFVERISQAHLMPTFDNVTTTLKKKWSWNK